MTIKELLTQLAALLDTGGCQPGDEVTVWCHGQREPIQVVLDNGGDVDIITVN
jgi:hypothetical protein